MNEIQKKLLKLSQTHNLKELSLREIGKLVGVNHPQKVKHHLLKLGILSKTKDTGSTSIPSRARGDIVSVPVYGLANCGPALFYAEPTPPESHLQISRSILGPSANDLFAVRASGNSMNKANVNGKNIEDDDYVIVNPEDKDFKDGDYVLSVINNLANIKKIIMDKLNRQIVLLSESTKEYPPIYISEKDFDDYLANAKVVDVFKNPKHEEDEITFEKISETF
jgi:SOS-response transcriptional repressor LexA